MSGDRPSPAASSTASPDSGSRVLRLGIIADTQYCDCEDGAQFGDPTRKRYYRNSAIILEEASKFFMDSSTDWNIILGDVLDGKCKRNGVLDSSMKRITDAIEKHSPDNGVDEERWTMVIGNHDLHCFTRQELYEVQRYFVPKRFKQQCSPQRLYHCQEISNEVALIYLDTYEVSVDGGNKQQAEDIIRANNPNWGNKPNWLEGLSEEKKKFVPYNGGMTDTQLQWLEETLECCKRKGQQVIVFVHSALTGGFCRPSSISWSGKEALDLLHSSGVVLAVFSGHDHDGGYLHQPARDPGAPGGGIRHICPPAPLEATPGTAAYGILHLESGRAKFEWKGGRFYPRELRQKVEGAQRDVPLGPDDEASKAFWDGEWW